MSLAWNDRERHRAADRCIGHQRGNNGDGTRGSGSNQAGDRIDDRRHGIARAPAHRGWRGIAQALVDHGTRLHGVARMQSRRRGADSNAPSQASDISRGFCVGDGLITGGEGHHEEARDKESHHN